MSLLRVEAFSVSLDGYGAGPDQNLTDPLGRGGERLHEWIFKTRTFGDRLDSGEAELGIDDDVARRSEQGIGATIMGRNMFGPIRGEWPDDGWTGWWGADPPFHHPVFVLTSHPREPVVMTGGTTFQFVTGGILEARVRAIEAAGGLDVRVGGGVFTIQQYLRAGLIDRLNLTIVPVLLGGGERLFDQPGDGLLGGAAGYECVSVSASAEVMHIEMARVDND